MMIMAGGIDLITIFIGLETMAVSFYILAGFIKPNQRSNEAAVKYFLLGAFSLGILLYGMSLMYGLSGTTNLRVMATAFVGQERDPRLVLAVILVVAGVGFKIAAVPFHMWAPDVYEGAPTPVTAFLSVGSKAASFAMLLRIFLEGLPSMSADWRLLFEVLADRHDDGRQRGRADADQPQAHAGVLVDRARRLPADRRRRRHAARRDGDADLPVRSTRSCSSARSRSIVLMRRQDVVGDELKDFSGLHLRHPFAAFAMLLFMLSLGGIPPTAGFMGKFWLFGAAIDSGYVLAGGHRRAEQRDLALLLHPRRRLHVSEEGDDRAREPATSPSLAVALARRRRRRRSCSASIRGCCSSWPRRRRGRWAPRRWSPRFGKPFSNLE